MKRFVKGIACAVLSAALLVGCGQKGELDTTSVYIRKDGSVASAVYEPFDTKAYSKDELKSFVEDAVIAYNQKNAGTAAAYTKDSDEPLSVAVTSLDFQDGDAVLKMEYASCDDYLQFNKSEGSLVQMASGTVSGAKEAGIDLGSFELLNFEGTDKIDGSDVDDGYYVVFVEGSSTIMVEGSIQYATADVKIEDKDTAQVSSEGALSCIVFK
ncbi:MAG: lipoprotein [Lachnospiraceae bacterium]